VVEHRGIREINGAVAIGIINMMDIVDKVGCYDKVLAASRKILNR
jgi:hypothetical protein